MTNSDWDIQFAKMFKERDNKSKIGNIIATVVSTSPLKLSIFSGESILQKEQLYCCNSLLANYSHDFTVSDLDLKIQDDNGITTTERQITTFKGKITFEDTLKVNDKVLLVNTEDEQTYFIIDKVTKL